MIETSLYSTIVETTRALIIVLDVEGRIVMFNPACERLTGYRFDEVRGRPLWDFLLLPEETDDVKAVFRNLAWGRIPNQHANHWVTRAGERRWIEWANSVVTDGRGKVSLIIGTGIDASERRIAEHAITQDEAHCHALAHYAVDITAIVDGSRRIGVVTSSIERVLGYTLQELRGQDCFGLLHPDDLAPATAAFESALRSSGTAIQLEHRLRCKDGSWRHFETRGVSLLDDPIVRGVVISSRDITERKRAEAALRESEANYRALFESSLDAILFTTPDGSILAANPEACRIFGRSAEELCDLGWAAVVDPTDPRLAAAREQRARTGHFKGELTLVRRDGTKFPVEVSTVAVKGINGENHTSSIIRDITERKLAEAQRIARDAAQREALVKEVHHRIKNNLQGTITLMQEMANGNPESADMLDTAITRLNALASLHGIYGTTGERELRLVQVMQTLITSLQGLHGSPPVRLTVRNPVNARVSESEAVPLSLILNELIMNAIKHSRALGDNDFVLIVLESAENGARVAIRNRTGKLPRHFNFDDGTGLGTGLALVRSLLPPSGMALRFENAPGRPGTEVELTLLPPVITLSPPPASLPIPVGEPVHGAHTDRRG